MAKQDLDLDVEAERPAKKSGTLKWILIGTAGLLVIVSASYATLYFAGVVGAPEAATAEAGADGKPADAPRPPPLYLPMDPAFVVNFTANPNARFLQISLQVSARDAAVLEQVEKHSPAIRNGLVMLFSSQDPVVLNSREGKEDLRQRTLEEINRVLKEQAGAAGVEDVFFTSFVMQ
ncbi:MAG: flagellar basal body-associated FliL family protein [Gammaproteobacteria bacterium]|jgi:flagellar FliL protein|nr:flagellar basal body-associated FliL family protein [Gammaproteobacteria bacterium]